MTLSSPENATVGTATATARIDDDTEAPVLSIADAQTVTEGVTARFEVTMAESAKTVTVQYTTNDGSAEEPGDYTSAGGTLTFTAGDTAKTIEVVTKTDELDEEDGETFTVTLSSPENATVGTATATARIDDDTEAPVLSIADAQTVTEGVTARFEVTMAESAKTVTVQYTTNDGSAEQPGDYTSAGGTLTFTAGDTAKTIEVVTRTDELDEDGETFTVTLSSPENATVGTATATARIDDDTEAPVLSIADAQTVTEGVTARFEVTMAESAKTVTVQYTTNDGSAEQPGDYTSAGGTLTFTAGDTAKTIEVVTRTDELDEDGETFTVTLSSPENATVGTATATARIDDDTEAPVLSIADAQTVTEGVTARFEVTMAESAKTVTVQYTTNDGSAEQPGDYTSAGGTLTFTAGDTAKTIEVVTRTDELDEDGETFTVTLSSPENATVGTATATARIDDDTEAPVLSIADAQTVTEGVTARFEVTMAESAKTVTVQYTTNDGSAEQPGDYTSAGGTLTFTAGDTAKTIEVVTRTDELDEDGETFTVTLSSPENATVGTATATARIDDDTEAPVLSIADAQTVTEGVTARFEVTMAESAKTVTVQYTTNDGSAEQPGDYTSAGGTLTFTAGDTAKTIEVVTRTDELDEDGETFTVTLSSPENATVGTATATARIDDDTEAPVLSIADAQTVTEGVTARFEVTMAESAKTVTVQYTTNDGSAEQPGDYTSAGGTLTFTAGDTAKTIEVVTKTDELDEEDGETFTVTLSSPENATVGTATATARIDDDTEAPVLSIADAQTVTEGVTARFEVTMAESAKTVTVQYTTNDGSAEQPGDYTSAGGTLTFTAGDTAKTIEVVTRTDELDEDGETFTVTLSSPENATVGTATATARIDDDTEAPVLSIADAQTVTEGVTARFEVTMAESAKTVTVQYTTNDGSAEQPGDYTSTGGTLTFTAGDTAKTIEVVTRTDELDEADGETFTVTLSSPENATVGTATATARIDDDTEAPVLSIADAQTVTEGVTARFEVTMAESAKTVTVQYTTNDGSAEQPGDYTSAGGTLTFTAGDTAKTIEVVTKTDELDEEDGETFTVTLSSPENATVGTATATARIDDDTEAPVLSIADAQTVTEGVTARFEVTMAESAKTVTVQYTTNDGSAEQPGDYTSAGGTLTFTAGDTAKTIEVVTKTDELDEEDGETFTVTLSSPENATLGTATATARIDDDTEAPVLSIADAQTVTEGVTARFEVTMAESAKTVTVQYTTNDGSAEQPGDYTSAGGTLTFTAGDTAKTIEVVTKTDELDEDGETFTVTLSSPENATVGTATATARIDDDTEAPVLSIADAQTVTEGVTARFEVTMAESAKTVTVQYTTNDGSAEQPGDYTSASGTLTFAAGDEAKTIEVVTRTDELDEEDGETFTVTLSSPENATLGTATATARIDDDTEAPVLSIADAQTVTVTARFEVTMAESAKTVTVQYTTNDGSAEQPGDYTSAGGTLTFTAGDTAKTIEVVTKTDELDEEDGETFTVTLSSPENATLGTATATARIDDDTERAGPVDRGCADGDRGRHGEVRGDDGREREDGDGAVHDQRRECGGAWGLHVRRRDADVHCGGHGEDDRGGDQDGRAGRG